MARDSGGGEVFLNGCFQLGEVGFALVAGEDVALGIDEVGDGESEDAAVEVAEVLVADDDGVGELEFAIDLLYGGGIVVHGDADDLEAVGGIFLLPCGEAWDLGETGSAPSGPEVEQDEFATVAIELDGFAGEVGEGEVGGELRGGLGSGFGWCWAYLGGKGGGGEGECQGTGEAMVQGAWIHEVSGLWWWGNLCRPSWCRSRRLGRGL